MDQAKIHYVINHIIDNIKIILILLIKEVSNQVNIQKVKYSETEGAV
jgi:hypothetical protein